MRKKLFLIFISSRHRAISSLQHKPPNKNPEQNDAKCMRQVDNLQVTGVVKQKPKLDLKNNTSTMAQDNELECKDIGIQVRISDDNFPGSMLKHQCRDSSLNGDGVLGMYVSYVC